MNTRLRKARFGAWIRWCTVGLVRRAVRQPDEAGTVLLEFAIILPLLITITFGIIEFSSAYHDSAAVADAARAGGRVGSASATKAGYTTDVANAVNSALQSLPNDAPQELWIYKANANGYPGAGTDFSSCATNCIKYMWNSAAQAFDTGSPQGGGWAASTHQVCNQPFDEIGVYVKIKHTFVTGLFGTSLTLTDHSVFRFEPVPNAACGS
jgi:hypothetical protein